MKKTNERAVEQKSQAWALEIVRECAFDRLQELHSKSEYEIASGKYFLALADAFCLVQYENRKEWISLLASLLNWLNKQPTDFFDRALYPILYDPDLPSEVLLRLHDETLFDDWRPIPRLREAMAQWQVRVIADMLNEITGLPAHHHRDLFRAIRQSSCDTSAFVMFGIKLKLAGERKDFINEVVEGYLKAIHEDAKQPQPELIAFLMLWLGVKGDKLGVSLKTDLVVQVFSTLSALNLHQMINVIMNTFESNSEGTILFHWAVSTLIERHNQDPLKHPKTRRVELEQEKMHAGQVLLDLKNRLSQETEKRHKTLHRDDSIHTSEFLLTYLKENFPLSVFSACEMEQAERLSALLAEEEAEQNKPKSKKKKFKKKSKKKAEQALENPLHLDQAEVNEAIDLQIQAPQPSTPQCVAEPSPIELLTSSPAPVLHQHVSKSARQRKRVKSLEKTLPENYPDHWLNVVALCLQYRSTVETQQAVDEEALILQKQGIAWVDRLEKGLSTLIRTETDLNIEKIFERAKNQKSEIVTKIATDYNTWLVSVITELKKWHKSRLQLLLGTRSLDGLVKDSHPNKRDLPRNFAMGLDMVLGVAREIYSDTLNKGRLETPHFQLYGSAARYLLQKALKKSEPEKPDLLQKAPKQEPDKLPGDLDFSIQGGCEAWQVEAWYAKLCAMAETSDGQMVLGDLKKGLDYAQIRCCYQGVPIDLSFHITPTPSFGSFSLRVNFDILGLHLPKFDHVFEETVKHFQNKHLVVTLRDLTEFLMPGYLESRWSPFEEEDCLEAQLSEIQPSWFQEALLPSYLARYLRQDHLKFVYKDIAYLFSKGWKITETTQQAFRHYHPILQMKEADSAFAFFLTYHVAQDPAAFFRYLREAPQDCHALWIWMQVFGFSETEFKDFQTWAAQIIPDPVRPKSEGDGVPETAEGANVVQVDLKSEVEQAKMANAYAVFLNGFFMMVLQKVITLDEARQDRFLTVVEKLHQRHCLSLSACVDALHHFVSQHAQQDETIKQACLSLREKCEDRMRGRQRASMRV